MTFLPRSKVTASHHEWLILGEPPDSVAAVKVRAILKLIEADGWILDRTRGSHRQYKHPGKRGVVTVPGKPGDDLAPGTQNSILKQAQLK